MLQFNESLSKVYTGRQGTEKEIYNRLAVRYGEIPYFNGGIEVQEFGFSDNLLLSVRRVLKDFEATVNIVQGRVTVGEIVVALPYEVY